MQLEVFEAALFADEDTFVATAVDWLRRDIAFDGLLWGRGPAGATLPSDQVRVQGRPAAMAAQYAGIAAADPVSRRAAALPGQAHALTIGVACAPGSPALRFWQAFETSEMVVLAKADHDDAAVGWLGLLRAGREPFGETQCHAMQRRADAILTAQQLRVAKGARTPAGIAAVPALATEALTGREMAVAQAYADGRSVKEVARLLGLSASTVQCHLARVYRKMGVHSKIGLRKVLPDRRTRARPA